MAGVQRQRALGGVPPWEGGRAGGERTRAVAGSVCAVAATGAQAANGNLSAARRPCLGLAAGVSWLECFIDGRIAIAGDWIIGPRIEAAYLSGLRAFEQLI